MSVDAFDAPVKAEVFHAVSIRRRIENHLATTFFVASFVVALIPLIWVL